MTLGYVGIAIVLATTATCLGFAHATRQRMREQCELFGHMWQRHVNEKRQLLVCMRCGKLR